MQRLEQIRRDSEAKIEGLRSCLAGCQSALVAFSAGVDSTFLLAVAKEMLGDRVVALTAHSPTMPREEQREARRLAEKFGVRQIEVVSREGENERYAANPIDRCYYCKDELFRLCQEIAAKEGCAVIFDGSNVDDGRDHRPGHRAAEKRGIRSPLAEAGLTKEEVRAWSEALGLPTWDKPQMACLASRLPYGTAITAERLAQVERAEAGVRSLGFRSFRVRFHGDLGRVEMAAEEIERAFVKRSEIAQALKAAGFKLAVLDLEPFRSGRLNELAGIPLPIVG